MTIKQVEKVLKTILDPELNVNIVDLGLIYSIDIKDPPALRQAQGETSSGLVRIYIVMTLTTPGCPLGGWFLDTVTTKVAEGMNVKREQVMVEITFDPPWSQDLMTEEAKATLGF